MSALPKTNEAAHAHAPNENFKIVEIVRDPDGIVAVITERATDGRVTFSIQRELDRNGRIERTTFLARRHLPAVRRLLDDLVDRLETAEDRARAKRR